MFLFGKTMSSLPSSSRVEDDSKAKLLQMVYSEMMQMSKRHPELDASELAALTLSRPDRDQLTIDRAISALASRSFAEERKQIAPKDPKDSTQTFKGTPMASASPSVLEGWDLIDSRMKDAKPTAASHIGMQIDQESKKPQAVDGPTEKDIVVTDFVNRKLEEREVECQSPEDSVQSHIQRCVMLGTLVSMLVEILQLQREYPQLDPMELANLVYETCSNGKDASILYEGALAIALAVPFTPVADSSDEEGSEPSKNNWTFLGHRVAEAEMPHENPNLDNRPLLSNAAIEFLVLEPRDGYNRLHIGKISDSLPQGAGCTIHAKVGEPNEAAKRISFGPWDKGILNGIGGESYGDGSKYVGNLEAGIPRGAGKMTYTNGLVREGNFHTWGHKL